MQKKSEFKEYHSQGKFIILHLGAQFIFQLSVMNFADFWRNSVFMKKKANKNMHLKNINTEENSYFDN